MTNSLKFMPIQTKAILTNSFAQGLSNQQTFTILRESNHNISYESVVKFNAWQQAELNKAFDNVFNR